MHALVNEFVFIFNSLTRIVLTFLLGKKMRKPMTPDRSLYNAQTIIERLYSIIRFSSLPGPRITQVLGMIQNVFRLSFK